jgi:hypothetical protein
MLTFMLNNHPHKQKEKEKKQIKLLTKGSPLFLKVAPNVRASFVYNMPYWIWNVLTCENDTNKLHTVCKSSLIENSRLIITNPNCINYYCIIK